MFRRTLLAASAAFLIALPVCAHAFKVGEIEIDHPWSRATAPGTANGAAFMILTNRGQAPDRLLAAVAPVAAKVELHTHVNDNGVMRMRPVPAIDVAPGTPTVLAPGGLHVMLMGLTAPLEKGSRFPLTLTFETAGTVTVEVIVEAAGVPMHDKH